MWPIQVFIVLLGFFDFSLLLGCISNKLLSFPFLIFELLILLLFFSINLSCLKFLSILFFSDFLFKLSSPHEKRPMTHEHKTEVEAAVFRRLVQHLQTHTEVQNMDLMILADFCRNCLSKWYVKAAQDLGETVDYEAAREHIYGMPYPEWKQQFQTEATPEQLALMDAKRTR